MARPPRIFLATLAFLAAVLMCATIYRPGLYNDDIAYIALARSLSQGHPYQMECEAGLPAHRRFPPGFPLLLAPAQSVAPHSATLMRLEVVLFGLAGLFVYARFCRRLAIPGCWPWAPLLLAANVYWLSLSSAIMSEVPFLFASFLYLGWLDRLSDGARPLPPPRRFLFLGLGLGLLCYLRSAGIAWIPATLVALAARSRPGRERSALVKALAGFGLGLVLAIGPQLGRSLLNGYDGELEKNPQLWQNVAVNAPFYPPRLAWMALGVSDAWIEQLPMLPGWALTVVGALGLWRLRRVTRAWLWVGCYLALILVWPYPFLRLLFPLLPFIQLGLCVQLARLPGRLAPLLFWGLFAAGLGLSLAQARASTPQPTDPAILGHIRALPPGQAVASPALSWWWETGVVCYSRRPQLAVDREWEWLQDLRAQSVGLVLVRKDQQEESGAFLRSLERRPELYRPVQDSATVRLYAFHPGKEWLRARRWHDLARQALAQQRYAYAQKFFERALQQSPGDLSSLSGFAYSLAAQGDLDSTRTLLSHILKRDPECGEAVLLQRFLTRQP